MSQVNELDAADQGTHTHKRWGLFHLQLHLQLCKPTGEVLVDCRLSHQHAHVNAEVSLRSVCLCNYYPLKQHCSIFILRLLKPTGGDRWLLLHKVSVK